MQITKFKKFGKQKVYSGSLIIYLLLACVIGLYTISISPTAQAETFGTFGKTTGGAAIMDVNTNVLHGGIYACSVTDVYAVKLSVQIRSSGTYTLKMGMWDIATNSSFSNSTERTLTATAGQWYNFSLTTRPELQVTNYALLVWTSSSGLKIGWSWSGSTSMVNKSEAYGDFPSSISGYSTIDPSAIAAMYCEYSDSATPPIDETPPTIGTITANATRTGNTTQLSIPLNVTSGLDFVTVEQNVSGTVSNSTWYNLNDATNSTFLYNFTMPTGTVQARVFVNSTTNIWSTSALYNFTSVSILNGLVVVGNKIYNSENEEVYLQGGDYTYFIDNGAGTWVGADGTFTFNVWNEAAMREDVDFVRSMNGTIIRVLATTKWWVEDTNNFKSNLETMISYCDLHDIIVDFTFWRNNGSNSTMPSLPYPPFDPDNGVISSPDDFIELWSNVSNALKGHKNVMFELWNEPYVDEAGWFNVTQYCVDAIRATGAMQPIILQHGLTLGYDFASYPSMAGTQGADFQWAWDYPISDDAANLVYSMHLYRDGMRNSAEGYWTQYSYEDVLFLFNVTRTLELAQSKPVYFGEIGHNLWASDQGNETAYFNNTLSILTEYNIGFAVWALPPWTTHWGIFATGANYTLNSVGVMLRDYMGGMNYTAWLASNDTYSLAVSTITPENTTYTSSTVSYQVSNSGNETGVTWQINLYNDAGNPVGANQTNATGSFAGLTNGTYTFAAYAIGANLASDYKEVVFTVAIPSVSYTLTVSCSSGGSVNPDVGAHVYANYTDVTVTATNSAGYHFEAWEINGANTSTSSPIIVTMSGNTAIKAWFEADPLPNTYTIALISVAPANTTYASSTIPHDASVSGNGTAPHWWSNVWNFSSSSYLFPVNLTSASATFSLAVNGTYRADFWASDAEGSTDSDSVIFTVAIAESPEPTPTPAPAATTRAEGAAATVFTNMYVAVGLIGVSFIVLAAFLIVRSLQSGEFESGAVMFGVVFLVGSVVGLIVGFAVIRGFENAMGSALYLLLGF
ncbi:MAG: cellulase family glycosylhydrolase [Candidatus Bathyarchaeia archaeon]